MSSAMKTYRKTARGKAANNRCSAKYYRTHKKKILANHRIKVECFFVVVVIINNTLNEVI